MLALMVCVVLLLPKPSASTKCDSLNNIEARVRTDRGNTYNKTLQGCIERVAFDDVILQAYIRNQSVPRLGPDSVRNMKHLHTIQFYRCQLETIEPKAFRNVPNLRSVQIVANELRRVPVGVFQLIPNLEILKMNRNKIDTIEDGAFSNISTLKKVYLENNLLDKWSKWWFANDVNLQVVKLQFNKIKTLPSRAFEGFTNLREIYFDYNELDEISPEAFEGLKKLDYLGLKYNRLKSIGYDAFPYGITINSLVIEANYLNFLPEKLFEKVVIRELTVDGNPWKCACFDEILKKLYRMNAALKSSGSCRVDNIPVCSVPSSQPRVCTETVDEELTKTHLDSLRKINSLKGTYCARLD